MVEATKYSYKLKQFPPQPVASMSLPSIVVFYLSICVEPFQFPYQQGISSEKGYQAAFGNKIIACNCDRYHGAAYKDFSY